MQESFFRLDFTLAYTAFQHFSTELAHSIEEMQAIISVLAPATKIWQQLPQSSNFSKIMDQAMKRQRESTSTLFSLMPRNAQTCCATLTVIRACVCLCYCASWLLNVISLSLSLIHIYTHTHTHTHTQTTLSLSLLILVSVTLFYHLSLALTYFLLFIYLSIYFFLDFKLFKCFRISSYT